MANDERMIAGIATSTRRLYTEGDELYASMLEAIRQARHSVKLESYIFADDEIGRRFAAALGARALAGLQVLVHLDAAGSLFWASRRLAKGMQRDGVQIRWFHRWNWRHPTRYNRRNHRKLLVVDGRVGFLGGFNIHRENSREIYGARRWLDLHVEVRGCLARMLQILFDAFWRGRRVGTPILEADGDTLITNHSRRGRHILRNLYVARFATTRHSIWLTTPYFVPDQRTRRSLKDAARRGVDVRVLVPLKSDVRLVQWAARAIYARMLESGVRIYKYLPRMLHAKTVIVDGNWCTIGTANIDYRSFFLNYELVLASPDAKLAAALQRQFLSDLQESTQIQAATWAQRHWPGRALERIGWLLRRWL